ncbi:MAG TPA: hydantoinase/oxoprolinase family protein [Anaerolineae bacterium]|nr:hydantoinase/oxoprolinase family protein [Anaerolineae bacterium]
MILGVDVGGTFTDFCLLDDGGRIRVHKRLTSPRDPSRSILEGIAEIGAGLDTAVVHGTTVATNALLERRGARTALITTSGFGDVLEIGRQTRPELYALHPQRPPPLVPSEWRFEVPERVAPARGRVPADKERALLLEPLDPAATDRVARQLIELGIESVAVCLLFSFLYPDHERAIRERLLAAAPDGSLTVSLSSDVLPEFREYERTTTTVINAYVAPLIARYLEHLEEGLEGRRLRIMQSNGGAISAQSARALAARTALSGPAGGVVGAFELARQAGVEQVITFDMGGTSTDVSLCPGWVPQTSEGAIAGLPLRLPIIDIHTVGAGGGSIAYVDAGGALRVGPQSAGADPGPACYGRPGATQPTVTDANLLLGRLDADHFLGGAMRLDMARSRESLSELAQRLRLSPEEAAWGVVRVANSNMERAIRKVSVERGHDPRRFTLAAFGGAGPLHACELAAALRIPYVLVPPQPGILSALGMILADVAKDYALTVMLPLESAEAGTLERLFGPLCKRAVEELTSEGIGRGDIVLAPALDMRYVGQSFEITVPLQLFTERGPGSGGQALPAGLPGLAAAFHDAHRVRFGYAQPDEPIEVVNLRLAATGITSKPVPSAAPLGGADPKAAYAGSKEAWFSDPQPPYRVRAFRTALYERERLQPGNVVIGPAVLVQLDCTTAIPPLWHGSVDGRRNLILRAAE